MFSSIMKRNILLNILGVFCIFSPVAVMAGPSVTIESLSLSGIDKTGEAPLAIIGAPGVEDDVFKEGDSILGIAKVEHVDSRSVLIRSVSDVKIQKTLYINGQSSSGYDQNSPENISLHVALPTAAPFGAQMERVTDNVIKIRWPEGAQIIDEPRTIYMLPQEQEAKLEAKQLGLGIGFKPLVDNGEVIGLEIGANERNSLLGGFGLLKGDSITQVNGQPVRSEKELKELVSSAKDGVLKFTYLSEQKNMFFRGTMLLRRL